ncbi:hypothetical protein CAPTEDRAFT_203886 [Capitella teleta]|uniref:Uncharacterized protein n=1 Tax=Capitella teleta TaxID=283909 RepID=R7UP17_CAPTE|nr:hypothetical protein CAPTEDRAFT_203886 [Capitella teleta]|eukprot:ELU07858.1 hypothetical protein CAPTEDRAFT_203886 [Capitella teleta]
MSSGSLADEFAEFFENKITAIRNGISAAPVQSEPLSDVVALNTFAFTNAEEISTLIRKSTSKSSAVDPIPTWLLKRCQCEIYLPAKVRPQRTHHAHKEEDKTAEENVEF